MSVNAMRLKARIRNYAKLKSIPAQVILQNYMFECLLVRLSASIYKEKFILKGGMLVAAIVGLDHRATMDLDTTLRNLQLTPQSIRDALEDIFAQIHCTTFDSLFLYACVTYVLYLNTLRN